MDEKKKLIMNLFTEATSASAKALEIIEENMTNRQNEFVAAAYINKAISAVSAAKAYYYSNLGELESTVLNSVFRQFGVFTDEFLTSLAENHSHQWTREEFNRYKDFLDDFAL